mmetsp:Transcript_9297/g.28711  ORF Transcript_9297/g.28711 Transcript_9297/m.28711 type:complete len:338 (+) Transcript_9297:2-1015(+)
MLSLSSRVLFRAAVCPSVSTAASLPLRTYSSEPSPNIKKVGVIGMGLMGHGIAQVTAASGFQVVALDTKTEFVESGLDHITKNVNMLAQKQVQKGKLEESQAQQSVKDTLARITGTTSRDDLADCDLVVEAIIENIDVKKELYSSLGALCKPGCIFATNTSSLSVTEMGAFTGRPSQMVGLHYFNPVQAMRLVEVVRTDSTSEEVFAAAFKFAGDCGKTPISCKDTPGFVVNRLLVPYLSEALALAERGVATVSDIDTAMRLGAGHPMGPITLADYVGLDTTLYILDGWAASFPEEKAFRAPASLRAKVAAGKFGRKTQEGFYKWDGQKVVDVSDDL